MHFCVSINMEMKIKLKSEEDYIEQSCVPLDETAAIEEHDNDIKNLTFRKDVLNNVLEKLIDKISQPGQDQPDQNVKRRKIINKQ